MSLPPQEIPLGAMRFNSDSQKLEYWNGSAWLQVHTLTKSYMVVKWSIFLWRKFPSGSKKYIDFNISNGRKCKDFGDQLKCNYF